MTLARPSFTLKNRYWLYFGTLVKSKPVNDRETITLMDWETLLTVFHNSCINNVISLALHKRIKCNEYFQLKNI